MSVDSRGASIRPRTTRLRYYTDSLWGFELREAPGERTRLVVSGYWSLRPQWLQPIMSIAMLEPAHWVMQTRQFSNLVRLASR